MDYNERLHIIAALYGSTDDLRCGSNYLLDRLSVFADTVATGSFKRHDDGNGWLGIRFQNEPHAPFSEIFIHVRMLDHDSLRQQEALKRLKDLERLTPQ